jgi:hypothetical protein
MGLRFVSVGHCLALLGRFLAQAYQDSQTAGVDEGDALEVEFDRVGAVQASLRLLEELVGDRQVELALDPQDASAVAAAAFTELNHCHS